MLPLIPIATHLLFTGALGGAAYGGLRAGEKHQLGKKTSQALRKAEKGYQALVRRHVDPWFGTRLRAQQLEEFSGETSAQEAEVNRKLGLSLLNVGVGALGAYVYPPLLLLNAAGLLYLAGPVIYGSLRTLVYEKRLQYRLFAFISVLANFLGGFYVIGSLMLTVVFIAFKVSARSEAYSRKALMGAFALHTPDTVWLRVDGVEVETPFSQLRIGDVLVLNAGQTVPVDGRVVSGMATLDQHRLTGESQPVEKSAGDTVLASTLVLSGKLHVRVEQTGDATAAAQMAEILNNTSTHHLSCAARSEQLADRLTLPVLAASGLALVSVGVGGAVAILNSGFGSTMFFAGPLSMLSYLNLASHQGILVKDGRALETLHAVDTVIFDKTGTLTLELPELAMIHCAQGWQEDEVLALAACAEHRQTHPIARAIQAAARQREVAYEVPEEADYALGFGLRVTHPLGLVRVGSARFMAEESIVIPAEIEREQARCAEQGCSLVMVALDGTLVGALELQAQLRPETPALIEQLHARGLKLAILSGDHVGPTRYLAERLGIDDYFAEVLPEGKAAQIQALQQAGRVVCFVGDGINDAIALQQADVSVSMRGATTLATDSAQVVLTSGSLHQLEQLFELAQEFKHNLDNTLMFSYVPGSLLIGGVFLLHFGMGAALVLYSAGLTGAIGNALYPLRRLQTDHPAAH